MKTHARALPRILLALLSALTYAQAPVPFGNQPLVPHVTAPGGTGVRSAIFTVKP